MFNKSSAVMASEEEDEIKVFISKLENVDKMDNLQILSELHKYGESDATIDTPHALLRILLKKVYLEEILKDANPDQHSVYSRKYHHLTESIRLNKKGFKCCYIGCRFSAVRHRDYIRHIKKTHPRASDIKCDFSHKCPLRFSHINNLISHVEEAHTTTTTNDDQIVPSIQNGIPFPSNQDCGACKCSLNSCGCRQFDSTKKLLTHVNTVHHSEYRECVFKNCDKTFDINSTSRHHFRIVHQHKGQLKEANLLSRGPSADLPEENLHFDSLVGEEESFYFHDSYGEADISDLKDDDEETNENDEEHFLYYYADFMNRLAHVNFIPYSTVQLIAEEFLQNSLKFQNVAEKRLRKVIVEKTDLNAEPIIQDVLGDNFFVRAQMQLKTQFKRTRFVHENMKYVKPVQYVLNKDEVSRGSPKDVVLYVPIDESLACLLEDQSFIKMMEKSSYYPRDEDVLKEVIDGSIYKTNYFKENPDAYGIILYSDGVEFKNPLGAARGSYKCVQVFYTLGNIPKKCRSKIDRLNLLMIFHEKLLKKYSLKTIFSKLLVDMKRLENGLVISCPEPKLIKAGLLCYVADNLEAHLIGGFSGSFSSNSICRVCHIQHGQLVDQMIYDENGMSHTEWTVNEYDECIRSLNLDDNDSNEESQQLNSEEIVNDNPTHSDSSSSDSEDEDQGSEKSDSDDIENDDNNAQPMNKWGLRHACPFNELSSFHCVTSLPFDLMHDLMEGVIAEDLLSIIRILSHKRWFSLKDYNKRLKFMKWFDYEVKDKPKPVPETGNVLKLKGKAISHWVHCRNFPIIIKQFILDKDDPTLNLGLKLHELTERITAVEFRVYEIELLEEVIKDYLELRSTLATTFPQFLHKAKPKHHNLLHYGDWIRKLGPPSGFWAALFECRHRLAKVSCSYSYIQ